MRNCEYIKELNKDGHVSQRNPMTKDYKIVDGLKEFVEWFYRRKAEYESNKKLQDYFAFLIIKDKFRQIFHNKYIIMKYK